MVDNKGMVGVRETTTTTVSETPKPCDPGVIIAQHKSNKSVTDVKLNALAAVR
jgi:hypothetical protein